MSLEWYYNRDDDRIGPVSEEELRRLISNGTVDRDTPVWNSDLPSWKPAGLIDGLFETTDLPRPTQRLRDEKDDRPRRRRYYDEDDYDDEDDDDDRPSRRRPGEQGSGYAIASLVLGLIGLPMSCLCGLFSLPFGILSIIFGVMGKKSQNRGLAIAGIVFGSLNIVLAIVMVIVGIAMQAGKW